MKKEEIRTSAGYFEEAKKFVEDMLNKDGISGELINETMLVFEALHHNLLEKAGKSTLLTIAAGASFGDVRITIGFEGPMFDPLDDSEDPFSPENRILRAYADKLDHSYHSGYNKISISVRRSYRQVMVRCMIAVACGIAVYIPVRFAAGQVNAAHLLETVIFPFETLFSNAILMIGAPVTFLSLIKNLTDVYILSERDSGIRKLQRITLGTSVTAVVLAIAAAAAVINIGSAARGLIPEQLDMDLGKSTISFILSSLIPPSIFEPFVSISPIPILILAALFTYAFCSVGKFFDALKTAVDAGYVLCSRVLSIIMSALPVFVFAAVLDLLISYGIRAVWSMLVLAVVVSLSLVFMAAFYAVRLKVKGVNVRQFVKDLIPLIYENMKINSAIDAVPYNVRYCARVFRYDRNILSRYLPVLAQINLDGNCYMLTMISLILIYTTGSEVSALGILAISALVLFLSLGAPNQPGTCFIGLTIIFTFLHTDDLLPVAICLEVLFGGIINIINVIGDIVTVAASEDR